MSEEEEIPSLADLQKLRVVDLKKELQRLGLSQSNHNFLIYLEEHSQIFYYSFSFILFFESCFACVYVD